MILFAFNGFSQTTKKVDTTTGANYANLRLTFNAINSGTLTGAIELKLTSNKK